METPVPEKKSFISWRFVLLLALSAVVLLLTVYCLQNGIQTIFTHIYYVPIILAAYWYQERGVMYSAVMGIIYLALDILITGFNPQYIVAADTRVVVFIIIAAVVMILSKRVTVQQRAIEQSEKKFHTIWEHIQAGIIVVDAASHEIISVNPEGERLTGYMEKEMIGHTCHQFICPAEKGRCPISDLGMTIDRSERVLLHRDGGSVPVLKTVTATTIDGRNVLIENYVRIPADPTAEKHE
ncbi:PAS domain S-box protein [Methanoregula sp.]|uniref:PAS domain S-box protein n=1 Tax=Methanoregula sp. TaxID=2052170 RepID=UPI00356257A0